MAALVATASLGAAAMAGPGPFTRMAGSWAGEGRVTLADGHTERVRCRASSEVGRNGDSMRQNLRCASPEL